MKLIRYIKNENRGFTILSKIVKINKKKLKIFIVNPPYLKIIIIFQKQSFI